MSKDEEHGTPDADNPEWTKEKFDRSIGFHELPERVQRALKGRGPQKAPTKQLVSLRLSPDVLTALRATGPGWQTRVDTILRAQLLKQG